VKPKKVSLTIYQGSTFQHTFYVYSDVEVVKPINGATNAYPTVLSVALHGLPAGDTPVTIRNVGDWIDSPSFDAIDRVYATKIDAGSVSVNKDGTDEDAYDGAGGVLIYNAPVALVADNWSARMEIRETKDSDDVLATFTSANATITLGDDGSILLDLDEALTEVLDFSTAVFDLEITDGTDVFRVAEGPVALSTEVTRT
jgi:hypothetical protein